jgi:hypothetical protein
MSAVCLSCHLRAPAQPSAPAPQAFLHDYEKWPLFHTGEGRHAQQNLDEFDDARETVASLSAEYRAAEHRDFVSGSHPVVPAALPAAMSAIASRLACCMVLLWR